MNQPKPDPILFTAAGFQAVKNEINRLQTEREQVLVRLQTAREMGDLSENGAYHAAKWELGNIDRRLRTLNYSARWGEVHQPTQLKRIEFGHQVTLKGESGTVTYELVSHLESNPQKGKLSVESPLGLELQGKQVGETVTVIAPAGESRYTITSISV